uniref:Uncharacterized protein n=1 Tax=Nothobranchius furzeri TaxID=105023 RepID=A0A8C6PNW0_NOTFU
CADTLSTLITSQLCLKKPQVYKVGIYDWRKRCLYFFILLLMILINLTLSESSRAGTSPSMTWTPEFLQPLYAKEIHFMKACMLFLQSSRNISVNIVNSNNQMLTQLITGSSGFKARGKMFEVKPTSGKLLFSADEQKVVVGGERLSVMGAEEEVFSKSVETPHVRAEPFKDLWLESPTRSLLMEDPTGIQIQILAEAGHTHAICRKELFLTTDHWVNKSSSVHAENEDKNRTTCKSRNEILGSQTRQCCFLPLHLKVTVSSFLTKSG